MTMVLTPMAAPRDLRRLFTPRSIAMIGASERSTWSLGIARAFADYGFTGKVFAVNKRGADAHGYQGFTSCRAIPIGAWRLRWVWGRVGRAAAG